MSSKVYANCGPCQDVAVERNVLIDCATGQPLVFPGADCNTPAWVKSCDPPQPECSLALAMNPITLEVVAVVACVSAGVPTFTQYNLDGTPYLGPQPVAIDKEWAFQTHIMCAAGATVTRTDVFLDGSNTPAFQIWQDMLGLVIAAPASVTYGKCEAGAALRVYTGFERIGSIFTLADALAASPGATRISAYTIKQISGHGSVTGDAGSGVPLDAGETWSGSANSGDNFDELSLNISFDPQGGEMRLMWQYVM